MFWRLFLVPLSIAGGRGGDCTSLDPRFGSCWRMKRAMPSPSDVSSRTFPGSFSTSMGTEIQTDRGTTILKSIGEKGPLCLQSVHQSYSIKEPLQSKCYQAHLVGTTHVYDFPDLLRALQTAWAKTLSLNSSFSPPKKFTETKELVTWSSANPGQLTVLV